MVEEEHINQIKEGVDLAALVRSRGVALKKNGKSYKAKCPFHEEEIRHSRSIRKRTYGTASAAGRAAMLSALSS